MGLSQERNYRLMGNMPLSLFPRLPHCSPHSVPGHWFPNLPHHWDPQGLLTQVLPGCLGLSQPCKETLRVWSLILSVPGGFLDLLLELPLLGLPCSHCATLGQLLDLSELGYPHV